MFIFFILFVSKRDEAAENIIALIEPVALCVGADMRPVHGRIEDAALFGNDGKFFFPAQIISDVVILDKGLARMAGLFDQHGDGNGRAAAKTKDVPGFLAANFSRRAAVAAQIEDIDGAELRLKAFAETVHSVAVQPVAIGNKGNDTAVLFVQPVRCPAEGLDIGIVERVFERR